MPGFPFGNRGAVEFSAETLLRMDTILKPAPSIAALQRSAQRRRHTALLKRPID